jgi:high affinity Mn2+ porin
MKFILLFAGNFLAILFYTKAQDSSFNNQKISVHFQFTTVSQYHFDFKAPYTGTNSLVTEEKTATSITSTIFLAVKTWKNATLVFNPELSGGRGLSGTVGMAGFANGENFRVGNSTPTPYVARVLLSQIIPLTQTRQTQNDAVNQLVAQIPTSYVKIVVGKYCLADYFDGNSFSHDPRTQHLNWSLMSAGAWDYAANTRGYTWGTMVGYYSPNFNLKYCAAMLPRQANGSEMDENIAQSLSHQIEAEWNYMIFQKIGALRVGSFLNYGNMGNYNQAVDVSYLQTQTPDITANRSYGRSKMGFYINAEQQVSENTLIWGRASWNDGKNET